jgi:hypothetical protein
MYITTTPTTNLESSCQYVVVTERDEGHASQHEGRKAKKPRRNREQNTQEARPNTNKRGPQETHPHETGSRHTHTCQPRRPPSRQPQTTSDHLGRGTREDAQRGPARHPSNVIQAEPAQGRVALAQGDAELPERPQDEGVPERPGPPGCTAWASHRPPSWHSLPCCCHRRDWPVTLPFQVRCMRTVDGHRHSHLCRLGHRPPPRGAGCRQQPLAD